MYYDYEDLLKVSKPQNMVVQEKNIHKKGGLKIIDTKRNGEVMKSLRMKKGLTQAEVADLIGVTPSAYTQYESGLKTPRDDTKLLISRVLGRSVKFIFFNEGTHLK